MLPHPDRPEVLRLTFEGDRFNHEMLAFRVASELAEIQEAIARNARLRFLKENPHRARYRKGDGVLELGIKAIENNCIAVSAAELPSARGTGLGIDARNATLGSALDDLLDTISFFETDDSPSTYERPLPDQVASIIRIGRSLRAGESLKLSGDWGRGRREARITPASRRRAVAFIKTEQVYYGAVEGEVDLFDHDTNKARILLSTGARVVFECPQGRAQEIDDAAAAGPRHKVRITGWFAESGGDARATKIERIEVEEEIRSEEIERDVIGRLDELKDLEGGWLDGDGLTISPVAIEVAAGVLARLLIAFPELDAPTICPMADGRVHASWFQPAGWSASILFGESLAIWAASHADGRQPVFGDGTLTRMDASAVSAWIGSLQGLTGTP